MKIKSILSMAFGAALCLALAAPAVAQDAPRAESALTMDALSMLPSEATTPENLDGSKVNSKTQREAGKILQEFNSASGDPAVARVVAINKLEALRRSDSQNLSTIMLLGYLLVNSGEADRAVEVLSPAEGKSKFPQVNRIILQNLALAHYLNQDYGRASDSYTKLAEMGSLTPGVTRFAGSAALLAKRYDTAIPLLESARSGLSGAEKMSLLKDLASAYVATNATAKAIEVYEEIAETDESSVEVLSWMGYSYVKEKQFDDAIRVLEKARGRSANDLAVLTNLGNAYLGRGGAGDTEKAVEVYTRLSEVAPNNPVAPYNVGVLRMKAGQYAPAAEAFRKATALSGSRSESRFAWNNLGFCYEKLNKHTESAAAYAKASDLDTSSGVFARNAGMAFTRAGDATNARKYLDRAKSLGASGTGVDSNLIENMVRDGRASEALEMLKTQATATPDNADIWFNIGVLSHRAKDLSGAESAYRKALDINPDDADALRNYGLLLIDLNKAADAVPVLEKLVGAYPSSVEGRMALGAAYVKLGRMGEATNVYREVVRLDSSRVDARLNLADGLWNQGLTKDARFHYTTVLKTQPSNARALNGVGLWHLLQSDAKSAESTFRRAVNSDPSYLPAYNNLGIALERLNRKAEAILILRKALDRDPSFKEARTNLNRLENPVNMQA